MAYELTTRKSWADTRGALRETFRKWHVTDWEIVNENPNKAEQQSYLQTDTQRLVMLRFTHPSGKPMELAMNRQGRAVDNLRVLYLAVEAIRLNEERGLDAVMREAYLQLPGPAVQVDPWKVMGLRPDADDQMIEDMYKMLAKRRHPDAGGTAEQMAELNAAYERVKAERNGT
jgi:hypothetical protein